MEVAESHHVGTAYLHDFAILGLKTPLDCLSHISFIDLIVIWIINIFALVTLESIFVEISSLTTNVIVLPLLKIIIVIIIIYLIYPFYFDPIF